MLSVVSEDFLPSLANFYKSEEDHSYSLPTRLHNLHPRSYSHPWNQQPRSRSYLTHHNMCALLYSNACWHWGQESWLKVLQHLETEESGQLALLYWDGEHRKESITLQGIVNLKVSKRAQGIGGKIHVLHSHHTKDLWGNQRCCGQDTIGKQVSPWLLLSCSPFHMVCLGTW